MKSEKYWKLCQDTLNVLIVVGVISLIATPLFLGDIHLSRTGLRLSLPGGFLSSISLIVLAAFANKYTAAKKKAGFVLNLSIAVGYLALNFFIFNLFIQDFFRSLFYPAAKWGNLAMWWFYLLFFVIILFMLFGIYLMLIFFTLKSKPLFFEATK